MSVRRRRSVSDGGTENTEVRGRRALIVGEAALEGLRSGTRRK
jgi:hypothetical protein